MFGWNSCQCGLLRCTKSLKVSLKLRLEQSKICQCVFLIMHVCLRTKRSGNWHWREQIYAARVLALSTNFEHWIAGVKLIFRWFSGVHPSQCGQKGTNSTEETPRISQFCRPILRDSSSGNSCWNLPTGRRKIRVWVFATWKLHPIRFLFNLPVLDLAL